MNRRIGLHDRAPWPARLALISCAVCPAQESQAPATSAASDDAVPFFFECSEADVELAPALDEALVAGRAQVEAFFGEPFGESVRVLVFPDRAAFTASFPPEWGLGETACWMVASGVADRLALLSPRVWRSEACEHDPDDAQHVQQIVTHELVHAFHGQNNPTRDFSGIEDATGWFAEGLAVLASGQLDEARLAGARRAVSEGRAPTRLTEAWSGPDRYGVCGTLVAFLQTRCGRDGLLRLLAATEFEGFLAEARLDEAAWLAAWQQWLLSGEPTAQLPGTLGAGVQTEVRALADAISRDLAADGPEAWLRHFEPGPRFFMASDGAVAFDGYAAAEATLADFDPTIAEMQLHWEDLRVDVLTPDLAWFGAAYSERMLTTAGEDLTFSGYCSALAVRTGVGWRLRRLHWSSPPQKG